MASGSPTVGRKLLWSIALPGLLAALLGLGHFWREARLATRDATHDEALVLAEFLGAAFRPPTPPRKPPPPPTPPRRSPRSPPPPPGLPPRPPSCASAPRPGAPAGPPGPGGGPRGPRRRRS